MLISGELVMSIETFSNKSIIDEVGVAVNSIK